MKELICIVCPRGCHLVVGDGPDFPVSGNNCPRGEAYGRSEVTAPKRVVTATCPADFSGLSDTTIHSAESSPGRSVKQTEIDALDLPRRVPVRTTGAVSRAQVSDLVAELLHTHIRLPVRTGDVIISNWHDSGVSVIATRSIG